MTCREMVEFLMAFLDGDLPPEQSAEFQGHLERCPPCTAYLASYRATVELGREACRDPEGEVPGDVPEQLVQAILAVRRRP